MNTQTTPTLTVSATHGVQFHAHTQMGTRGGVNQDSVLAMPPTFFGVADGVGGGSFGEIASAAALKHASAQPFGSRELLAKWIEQADVMVARELKKHSDQPGATTFCAAWLDAEQSEARIVHVGDARAYLFRAGSLEIVTKDHTFGNLNLLGGEADDPCWMLGTGALGELEALSLTLRRSDLLIMCSDGLHRFLPHAVFAQLLQQFHAQNASMKYIAETLAQQAVQYGSYDDVSVVILKKL